MIVFQEGSIELRPRSQHGWWTRRSVHVRSCSNSIQHLRQAGRNTLLLGMPHEKAHCPMTVIKKPGMADANVIK